MISVFVIGVQAMQQSYNKRIDKGLGCTSKVYRISKHRVKKKAYDNPEAKACFRREMKLLRTLSKESLFFRSPYIGKPYFETFDFEHYTYQMPYYGETLKTFLENQPTLSIEVRRFIIGCIRQAVYHMHQVGYVHCDIKLENIS